MHLHKRTISKIAICICYCFVMTSALQSQEAKATHKKTIAYSYDGLFGESSTLFLGNQVNALHVYIDHTKQLSFDQVLEKKKQLKWELPEKVTPEYKQVYWLKTRLVGNPKFLGQQLFHISDELGRDHVAFEFIESYTINSQGIQTYQQTGNRVPLEERPINFWATLIEINIQPTDTTDLYIRLEGINRYFPMERFSIWHIDSKSMLANQVHHVAKAGIFFGILGIQIIFFICLYVIEKEMIYFFYAIFVVGLFLTNGFLAQNYSTFPPFHLWVNHIEKIYFAGVYTAILGGLYFILYYLRYPKQSPWFRKYIPIFLGVSILPFLMYIFRFEIHPTWDTSQIVEPSLFTVLSLFLALFLILRAQNSDARSKLLLLVALLPIIIATLLNISYDLDFLPEFIDIKLIDSVMKIGNVTFILTLALIVGYRSNKMKEEKEIALQQVHNDQKIILEKQLRTTQLEEIDRIKTQLFTNITHEFRTPLSIIMGLNEELSDSVEKLPLTDNQKQKRSQNYNVIDRNSRSLMLLINQLLDLSKADSNKLSVELIQADIIPYLNYLTESFYSKAKEKNIRLVFYPETFTLQMDFDEHKMQHIIYNLLSNALKFTPENGKVVLHAKQIQRENKDVLEIKVSDNGIGIPEEKAPFIFDRFYQVSNSDTRMQEGSGVGLALTKEYIFLMGGDISVRSELDKGSVFTVIFPISTKATCINDPTRLSKEFASFQDNHSDLREEFIVTHDSSKALILIIEDNKDVLHYIQQILEINYTIVKAMNGELGIQKAIELTPDLIISDVMMPIKDGITLTKTLKTDQRTSHIPIILLTAKATENDKLLGLEVGADSYLHKPFNKKELLLRIENLLELQKAVQAYFNNKAVTAFTSEVQQKASTILTTEAIFMQGLQLVIEQEIDNADLSIDDVCRKIGLSQAQLYRKLKAITNETPVSFIRKIRLEKSLELLKETDLTIKEIAFAVGFSTSNYFIRVFSKTYGYSPNTLRKIN